MGETVLSNSANPDKTAPQDLHCFPVNLPLITHSCTENKLFNFKDSYCNNLGVPIFQRFYGKKFPFCTKFSGLSGAR